MGIFSNKYTPARLYDAGGNIKKEWYIYYGIRDPETGKMAYKKDRGGINYIKSKKERRRRAAIAIEAINEMLREGWNPLEIASQAKTTRTLIDELQEEFKRMEGRSKADRPTLTHDTCIVYKSAMNIFIRWLTREKLSHIKPLEFTKKLAYAYSDYMIQELKYSGVTYNARKIYLGTFFNSLMDREIVTVNHFEKLKPLPETSARVIAFTEKEIQDIEIHLKKINRPGLLRFFQFILFQLMRGKEVSKIQLFDITDNGVVLIYGDKGKTKLRRAPTIPQFMIHELQEIKSKFPNEYYLFGKDLLPGSRPVTIGQVRRLFKKYVRQPLGIPDYKKIYHAKYTGITRAYNSGKSIRAIQMQAGHATEQQTRQYLIQHGIIVNEEFR